MTGIAVDPNAEAIAAWDGPLYDRFVRFRKIVTTGLGIHGERALELYPPQPDQRVLDIGCGFGDTTQQIANLVGPSGEAVGIDAAARFIKTARREADEAEVSNIRFEVTDVQREVPGGPYDRAFSRLGTMFFHNPVVDATTAAALKAVHPALPCYPQADDRVKLAAGWLIEQAGWKGKDLGPVGMYEKQALVLVNRGGATCEDVQRTMTAVQAAVREKFAVELTPEPVFL